MPLGIKTGPIPGVTSLNQRNKDVEFICGENDSGERSRAIMAHLQRSLKRRPFESFLGKGYQHFFLFSSTGPRPASYCHCIVSVVHPSVCVCVCKLFLQKTSPQKLLTGFLPNFTGMFLRWFSFKFLQIIVFHDEFWLPWQPK